MKIIKLLSLLMVIGMFFGSCKKEEIMKEDPADVKKIENVYAPSDVRDHQTGEIIEANEYIYFDISAGSIVEKSKKWDIAFKGTSIITNSGTSGTGTVSAALLISTFGDVTEAPNDDKFNQDTELLNAIPAGSGNGWYDYNPTNHLISPIPGRVIVIKTMEGNYAKMEILSYYKDAPSVPNPSVDQQDTYTFNYAYQKNGSKKF